MQCSLGTFGDLHDDVKKDVLASVQKQVATRQRLLEMQLDNMVTAQGYAAENVKKKVSKLKVKKQNSMLRNAMLKKALKKDQHELKDNLKSRMEIMHSIVPEVQAKTKKKAVTAKAAAKKKALNPKMQLKMQIKMGAIKLAAALLKSSKAKGGKVCHFSKPEALPGGPPAVSRDPLSQGEKWRGH